MKRKQEEIKKRRKSFLFFLVERLFSYFVFFYKFAPQNFNLFLLVDLAKVELGRVDDCMLDTGLVVVGVSLGAHPEVVGLEAGFGKHVVEPYNNLYVNFKN